MASLVTLRERVLEALQARTAWEQKQLMFDVMRNEGLRRANKPFPRRQTFICQ